MTPTAGNIPLEFVNVLAREGECIDLEFERFTVLSLIGVGGLGVVVKARKRTGETVALKFLYNPPKPNAGLLRQRFKQEIATTKMVGDICDACVKVFECGEYAVAGGGPAVPFFSMEYVSGISLEDLIFIKESPFNLLEIYAILRQILDALEDIHAKGIVHRDIKPSNILFDEVRKVIKITAFGIFKDHNTASELTQVAEAAEPLILGSLPYLSRYYFESIKIPAGEVAPGSDGLNYHRVSKARVFTEKDGSFYTLYKGNKLDLSVVASTILYELITRENPYCGAAAQSVIGDLMGASRLDVRQFYRRNPDGLDESLRRGGRVLRQLDRIIKKAVSPDIAHTYGSAAELRRDLDRLLRRVAGRPLTAGAVRELLQTFFATTITREYAAVLARLENSMRTNKLLADKKNVSRIVLLYKLHRTEQLMELIDTLHKQAHDLLVHKAALPGSIDFFKELFADLKCNGIEEKYGETAGVLRKAFG
ncbi:MAG: protein kinase [Chitinivibrionales bacterium]|nr:protein kinase [Chitinivibrionales bacterium]